MAEKQVKKEKGHPEDYCHLCGRENITWYVANELWNKVVGSQIICCPICFVKMAEKKGITPTAWRLSREGDSPEVDELRLEIADLREVQQADYNNAVRNCKLANKFFAALEKIKKIENEWDATPECDVCCGVQEIAEKALE